MRHYWASRKSSLATRDYIKKSLNWAFNRRIFVQFLVRCVFASIAIQNASAADIGMLSPQYMCSCEIAYKSDASYQDGARCFALNTGECNTQNEVRDGAYYYQQKYESVYIQDANPSVQQTSEVSDDAFIQDVTDLHISSNTRAPNGSPVFWEKPLNRGFTPFADINNYFDDGLEMAMEAELIDDIISMAGNSGDAYLFQYESGNENKPQNASGGRIFSNVVCSDVASEVGGETSCIYQYALPWGIYGSSVMPYSNIMDINADISEGSWCDINRYLDEAFSASPYTIDSHSDCATVGLQALYKWDPQSLLTYEDQQMLRELATLEASPSGMGRALLNDYIKSLGAKAVALSRDFQHASGLVVTELADDLVQTAAFIACFRLVERQELQSTEALALWMQSRCERSQLWNCWVDEVLAASDSVAEVDEGQKIDNAQDVQTDSYAREIKSAADPMLKAVVFTAAASLDRLGGVLCAISRQMKNLY